MGDLQSSSLNNGASERTTRKDRFPALLSRNERMREVSELIARVADTDVTVLVCGESGTGKELVARAIHAGSPRRDRIFVKVNCAALPSELLESELFGFERGAFTGATQHRPGKFEFANHGTMFLDEISEMQPALQAKLLQVLQDGEFARLGAREDVRVDVRVIAATNRDLEQAVADGHFREDLFFRLNVVSITLPPLRQRRDEIPSLAELFLRQYSEQYKKRALLLTSETLNLLLEHDWPGNVRELENVIKRMVILGSDEPIRRELRDAIADRKRQPGLMAAQRARDASEAAAPPPVSVSAAANSAMPPVAPAAAAGVRAERAAAQLAAGGSLKEIARQAAREAERELIFRTLQQTCWNRRKAAKMLGVSYKALLYKIKEAVGRVL
jgi:two-component system, NtrC family, response regulator AtoC